LRGHPKTNENFAKISITIINADSAFTMLRAAPTTKLVKFAGFPNGKIDVAAADSG